SLRARLGAEDILQDVLLHAWRDRSKLRWEGMRAFRSWLLTSADRRIVAAANYFEAQKRGGGRFDAADAAERWEPLRSRAPGEKASMPSMSAIPGGTTTPGRMAAYREQATAMQGTLESLPEEVREVVRLRLFAQQPVDAIAQALGIGESAVRHRMR